MVFPFCTVGHSTRPVEELVGLLRAGHVAGLVDIRTVPRSRTNPQFNRDTLGESLAPFQIGYSYLGQLGGLRSKSKTVPPETNGLWRNDSFHNYADYALSAEFRAGMEALIALGRTKPVAIMCAEAVWWRCHRRIVADHLLARGEEVFHLMGEDRVEEATPTKGAVFHNAGTAEAFVTYPKAA